MARIYVSSSWKNEYQPILVEELRKRGHEVYDFRHPYGRNDRNVWETYFERLDSPDNYNDGGVSSMDFFEALGDAEVLKRFSDHYDAMLQSDICILLLPCGRSSHVEAGFMKGLGKAVYVLNPCDNVIPELMYNCFNGYFYNQEALFSLLPFHEYSMNCCSEESCPHEECGQCDCIKKAENILSEKVGIPVSIDTSIFDDGTERISLYGTYRKPLKNGRLSKEQRIGLFAKYCPICGKPYNKSEVNITDSLTDSLKK